MENRKPKIKMPFYKRLLKVFVMTVLIVVGMIILIGFLIQTAPVQNFIKGKVVGYLNTKLHTKVAVGKIYISFPKNIVVDNICIEDRRRDTIFSAGSLVVDLNMLKLLHGNIEINNIDLRSSTIKVKRLLPDTVYNFQFIIDAFSSPPNNETKKKDTSSTQISLHNINLEKIKIVYKDVLTGNDDDVYLEHFAIHVDEFDLQRQRFSIPTIAISGLRGKVYQDAPLVRAVAIRDTVRSTIPSILLKNINLKNIDLDYKDQQAATNMVLQLDDLTIRANKVDLSKQLIDLETIGLSVSKIAVRTGRIFAPAANVKINSQQAQDDSSSWKISINAIDMHGGDISFDNDKMKLQKSGVDYAHLHIKNIVFSAKEFLYSNDTIAAQILKGSLEERSGFSLTNLAGSLFYSGHQAYIKNLAFNTPGSQVKGSVNLHYPSLDAIEKNLGLLVLDIDFMNGILRVDDILAFAPFLSKEPAFRNPEGLLRFNTRIRGSLADLQIDQLQFSGFKGTLLDFNGRIKGLPRTKNLSGDLSINRIYTTSSDITMFSPPGSLPQNIAIPDSLALKGDIRGSFKEFASKLSLKSSFGAIDIRCDVKHADVIKNLIYDCTVSTNKLNIGKILKDQQEYGEASLQFTAKGNGTDLKSARAQIDATISSAEIKKYAYQDIRVNVGLIDQVLNTQVVIHDQNIDFSLNGNADLNSKYPSVHENILINTIQLKPLHLLKENIVYKGNIGINFESTDPDNLDGALLIEKSIISKDSNQIAIDSIKLYAGKTDSGQYVRLNSDIIQAGLQGKYKLTELGTVFTRLINPYFSTVPPATANSNPLPYNFTVRADIENKPLLKTLMPSLKRLDPIHFSAMFSSEKGWNVDLVSPMIVYDDKHIQNFQVHVKPSSKSLEIDAALGQFTSGKSLALYATTFTSTIADNKINFIFNVHDQASKEKYNIAGLLDQPEKGKYTLSLSPKELMLNYQHWQIDKDNLLSYSGTDIKAVRFNLTKGDEQLSINSETTDQNSPLDITFSKFLLSTLSALVGTDSLTANGELNGKIVLKNIASDPIFTTDLSVNNLSFFKDTVGNISLKVNNESQNRFSADIGITGHGNDIALTGDYYTGKGIFDFNININKLSLNSIVGASMGALNKASGSLSGKLSLKGTMEKPDLNGDFKFDQAMITPKALNNDFIIDDQNIQVVNDNIKLNNLTILDSVKNRLVLNGAINSVDLRQFSFDFSVNANNFRALNSTKRDNQLFHGKLYFNCDLHVKGTTSSPVVDGTFKINDKTNLTIVIPEDQPGVQDRQGVIEFVNKRFPAEDSLNKDTVLVKTGISGADISANIIIDSNAVLNIVIDQNNGDALIVKGRATLVGGSDQSGKTTLTGTLQIASGSYDLSFSLLKRTFKIQSGSTIVWTGEPTKANLNINAIMVANTAPIDLVDDQLAQSSATVRNTYLQKLPFEVHLIIKGELLRPQVSFDIVLPEDKSYSVSKDVINTVESKLDLLRQDSGELNKQVFALLLLNRFVGDDPFASDQAGMNAESLARASVSKILSQQLNKLASSLIKGVDVNFDLQSTDDYTTGQLQNRTDLNVSVSKRLLNDRLTVTVGSDFELEGPQNESNQSSDLIGNVAVDYKLSKDGRYALRAYRKDDYDDIVEGYVVETGMGFVITVDYNKFKEIFQRKKKSEKQ
jgi:translocation and assembly module TamB